jgi:release factor glutamine methyltransferase
VRRPTVPGLRPGAATEATVGGVLARLGRSVDPVDAEWLVSHVLGMSRSELALRAREPVAAAEQERLAVLAARRTAGEPLQYVLGEWGFRRLTLTVDRRGLIPRPETEIVVERCLALLAGLDRPRVLDVGTGSGAIALALLDERPDLHVSASEVSPDAVDVARENAARLGLPLEVEVADGLPPGDYDLVIANLPYVRDDRWEGLMPEINRYEPRVAITSGTEGLDAIRDLIAAMPSGTRVALEHHHDQADEIRELLDEAGSYPDLASWDRITVGRVP